jgi:hypothetical protein
MSNFYSDLSFKLSQGEVHDFSGEVQNDLRGGAHLPTHTLKIQPWDTVLPDPGWSQIVSFILLHTEEKIC